MDINILKNILSEKLPHSRYIHSLGVMEEAVRLSKRFGGDCSKAAFAGLIHDITKPLSADEQLNLCKNFGIILSDIEKRSPKLLHAITGAEVARHEFSIDDDEIINSIRYHTTARANMTDLDKIIYLADFIEPNRNFEGVDELRHKVYENIDNGLFACLDFSILEVLSKGYLLHPDTVAARNFLILSR